MIYLVGTNHQFQIEWDTPGMHEKCLRFKDFLRDAIGTTAAAAIAEEADIGGIQGKKTIAHSLAESFVPPIPYVPCDPNTEERRCLGIPTAEEIIDRCQRDSMGDSIEHCQQTELLKYFPVREKFWMERLRKVDHSPILYICGQHHIRTFFCRLTDNGVPCIILSFDWVQSDDLEHGSLPRCEVPA